MAETFTYEHAGKTHSGTFTIKSKMITVTTALGTKTTQVGGSPPLVVARMLARDLVLAAKVK